MVIAVRRQLLKAVRELQSGTLPADVDNVELDRVRAATLVVPTAPIGKAGPPKPATQIPSTRSPDVPLIL